MTAARRLVLSLVAAGALLLAVPQPAFAINTDPRCQDLGFPVDASPDATDEYPDAVPVGAADCSITFNGRTSLFYFAQPFDVFLSTIDTFAARGWQPSEVLQTGERVTVDIGTLESREQEDHIEVGLLDSSGAYLEVDWWNDLDAAQSLFSSYSGDLAVITYSPPRAPATGFGDPGILSSLKRAALPSPAQTGFLLGGAVLITALIGFPGLLLGAVLQRHRLRVRMPRVPVRVPAWVALAATVVVAAVLSGFIDPAFGFNGLSLRVVLTQALAFAVFNVGGWLVLHALRRRLALGVPALTVRPLSLVAIAVFVVLSRLLVIEPGIVFGLVTAIVFADALTQVAEIRVLLVGAAFAAAVGVVSWILYSVIPLLGVREFFAGLALQGVSTLPLALLPLALLDGATLFRWNRAIWAGVYAASIALFMLVVLRLPSSVVAMPTDFVRWVLAFAGFAVVAVVIWAVDRRVARRTLRG